MSHLIAILLQMYVFSAKPPKIERNFSDWVGKKTASFFGSIQIKVHFCTVDEKKSKGEGGSRGQVHVAHFSYTQDVFCIDFVIFREDRYMWPTSHTPKMFFASILSYSERTSVPVPMTPTAFPVVTKQNGKKNKISFVVPNLFITFATSFREWQANCLLVC